MLDKKSTQNLSHYDVTQQIIETLANVYSRAVLFCIIETAKDAQTIADDQKMSVSTVYKILSQLENLTLIEVDRYEISDAGKKIKYYKSRIKKAEIIVGGNMPILNLQSN